MDTRIAPKERASTRGHIVAKLQPVSIELNIFNNCLCIKKFWAYTSCNKILKTYIIVSGFDSTNGNGGSPSQGNTNYIYYNIRFLWYDIYHLQVQSYYWYGYFILYCLSKTPWVVRTKQLRVMLTNQTVPMILLRKNAKSTATFVPVNIFYTVIQNID